MKTKFYLTAAALLLLWQTAQAQSPNLQWAKHVASSSGNGASGEAVVVDAAGNVYTIGGFLGTLDFDPGPGVFNLTPIGGATFVQKLDAAGN